MRTPRQDVDNEKAAPGYQVVDHLGHATLDEAVRVQQSTHHACRCSSMVELLLPKQAARVRFPSSAPILLQGLWGKRIEIAMSSDIPNEEAKTLLTDDALLTTAIDTALALPATELYPFTRDWEAVRVRGKWFLVTTVREHRMINVKAEPLDVLALRQEYASITPGYHMNKKHWISIQPGADITESLVQELVTDSYLLVVASLPRAERPVDPETFGRQV